jgi:outer membrane lipoprotein-sorting protein
MQPLMVPLLVFALGQDTNQAEKAFRAAEKKLAEADTVQITFDSAAKGKGGEMKLKGTVLMAKGNKSRTEMTGEFGGQSMKMTSISDGKKTKTETTMGEKKAKGSVRDTPKNANAMLAGLASRAGFLLGYLTPVSGPGRKPRELDDLFTVSHFSLGKKEKIGERQAQRIDYKLTMVDKKEPVDAQVWLDSETNLPLKRVFTMQDRDKKIQFTETYNIRIGAKIDAKKFVLPK